MSEINNKPDIPQFRNIQGSKAKQTEIETQGIQNQNLPEITDFSNPKAEALGRSMVTSKIDGIEADIDFMLKNPHAVEMANEFFDAAYNTFEGQPDAYAKAAMLTGSEFLNK